MTIAMLLRNTLLGRPRRRRGAGGGGVELSRLRPGELIAAAGGVALLVVMFLDWYAVGGTTSVGGSDVRISLGLTAWEAFGITDILLALAALSRSASRSSRPLAAARRCRSPRA